ncbi:sigma-70 family RNA polymerase sigma factor [Actinokineospora enzanensis]|uniref:sigma-70 family RNA polymerase sigma factor n=1 Tax=Actinokineospora enzanensis TaxID=155975 RepID=UPI00036BA23F|nr:sigma-70 family RNA polymerase sigma factor [Actinokineospora enzanensis]
MDWESHRVELTGYCYRMLASGFEAEDAVQETFAKAWKAGYDEQRGSLRAWLYSIATNVCLDMLRSPQRRALAVDLAPVSAPGKDVGAPLPETAWVQPVPDAKVLDPADQVVAKQSVRLAFVAALQHLPPRQRAVLILRDVLCWKAAEVAELLSTSTEAVNSVLQRARALVPAQPTQDEVDQSLLDRYCRAFEAHDVDTLVSLLRDDATMSMPPFQWWIRGKEHQRIALLHADGPCLGATLVPTHANGGPAFGHYGPDGAPFALITLDVVDGRIAHAVSHLDTALFPLFELPSTAPR